MNSANAIGFAVYAIWAGIFYLMAFEYVPIVSCVLSGHLIYQRFSGIWKCSRCGKQINLR